MKQRELNVLSERVPKVFVKQREGSRGMMLDYVEAAFVVQRLNETFEGNWSFMLGQPFERQNEKGATEVIVQGTLSIVDEERTIIKNQFGSVPLQKGMEIGDTYKGAASDALKKCATLLGLGLELYGEEYALKPRLDRSVRMAVKDKLIKTGKDFTEMNKDFTESHGYSMFTAEPDTILNWLNTIE